jgi:hypothetical protein
MKMKPLLALSALLIAALLAPAAEAQVTIRKVNLKKAFINAGQLRFVITSFEKSAELAIRTYPGQGPDQRTQAAMAYTGYATIYVENVARVPVDYHPEKISFVTRDNELVTVKTVGLDANATPPVKKSMPPGGKLAESYVLTNRIRLPACFCYDGNRLAWITN